MSEPDTSEAIYCSEGVAVLGAPELAADGWQQRTVTDSSRIAELQELYGEMGFKTKTTGLDPESFGLACTTCAVTACSTYVALFTKKQEAG